MKWVSFVGKSDRLGVKSLKIPRIAPFAALVLLLGLPMLGILAAGHPTDRYLEFPPQTLYVQPASFSWMYFVFYGLVFLIMALPILIIGGYPFLRPPVSYVYKRAFPWWGWAGLALNAISWFVAWTRIPAFAVIQPHTFFPLWLSFILVVNALCQRRDGACMMTRRPVYFALLFPASAIFWWVFEYLNRFVQNWHYLGIEYGALEYAGLASFSFSTVLPAVLGTRDWLLGTRWIQEGFIFQPPPLPQTKGLAVALLIFSGFGLFGIGIWPNVLFPLLWVSPLLIILCLQILTSGAPILSSLRGGDLRPVVSAVLAALLCGWFWEMWNYYSLAKWVYRIPYVHRFEIFEMPVLGYAGYLPFGLECAAVGDLLDRTVKKPLGLKPVKEAEQNLHVSFGA
ncbi:MAG: hypothetical protein COS92_02020 [Desulfobacterales bacterium CG07_land_8_20_14_0_80_52_14]|nr:MAG: hypothetical protein COS92_02020 [Desulfobacterales bacterium CG07_land_8_20_14_0_80_52_14]